MPPQFGPHLVKDILNEGTTVVVWCGQAYPAQPAPEPTWRRCHLCTNAYQFTHDR
jgi:hypothetical protein